MSRKGTCVGSETEIERNSQTDSERGLREPNLCILTLLTRCRQTQVASNRPSLSFFGATKCWTAFQIKVTIDRYYVLYKTFLDVVFRSFHFLYSK